MNADMKWLDNPEVFRVNQLEAHSDHTYYESYEALELSLIHILMIFPLLSTRTVGGNAIMFPAYFPTVESEAKVKFL